MPFPTVAIIGASPNREKFGNKAVRAYASRGYTVYPVHPAAEQVEGFPCYRSIGDVPGGELDRVSIYLPPAVGLQVIEEVARRGAHEVWLNPGAESPELIAKARALGLHPVVGCSIRALGVSPRDLD